MVDLSRPQELLVNLTTLLRDIRKRTDGILADNRAKELRSILTDAAWNRVGQDHQVRVSRALTAAHNDISSYMTFSRL